MYVYEKGIEIPKPSSPTPLIPYFSHHIQERLASHELPIRFVVTRTDPTTFYCELGILSHSNGNGMATFLRRPAHSIFDFRKRDFDHVNSFNAVLLVPTGIGAEIGGHAGDATPVARLLAAACDTLITHPNVVNASDINEMSENTLYVEGSIISRLLMGSVALRRTRSNRVMLIVDVPPDIYFQESAINAASAARASFGLDCPLVVKMTEKMPTQAFYAASGRAVGKVDNFGHLCQIAEKYRDSYDAIALSTIIDMPKETSATYWKDEQDMINPWGGIEAMLTHALSMLYDIPSAHSPMMDSEPREDYKDFGVVDPRKSAEAISNSYLHCILKGLHRSPRIVPNAPLHSHTGLLSVADVSCLVIPDKCVGLPTLAALEQGIPVIAVRENKNKMENNLEELPFKPNNLFMVDNYLEAAGVMTALRAGVALETTRRPLAHTTVYEA